MDNWTILYTNDLRLDPGDIRVLTLFPGNVDGPIQCGLSKVSFNEQPQYSALSYVWGDPNDRMSITVNNLEIQVTSSLETALRHLRSPTEQLIIWIDAVCIDQINVEERNAQVRLMGEIYSKATSVFLWIGEADHLSDNALDSMIRVASGVIDEQAKRETCSFYISVGERPWFKRVWVLQEMALASQDPIVVCGTRRALWSIFISAWRVIAREIFSETDGMRMISGLSGSGPKTDLQAKLKIDVLDELRQAVQSGRDGELRRLLLISRTSESTDPRDRIYGLLGMMESGTKINVDYSLSTAQVYTQAMAHIFAKGIGPLSLSGLWLPGLCPNIEGLPSWVPDFSAQTSGKAVGLSSNGFHPPYPLSVSGPGAGAENGKVLDNGYTVLVEALPVDIIEEVLVLDKGVPEALSQLPKLEAMVAAAKQRDVLNEQLRLYFEKYRCSEPLWKVLICNSRFASGYDTAPPEYEEQYERLRANISHLPQGVYDTVGVVESRNEYINTLRNHLPGRAFFTTRNGLFGLAVPEVLPGDEFTIWFGASIPFVVRHEGKLCRLVGGAYVGGIMAGEMVDELYCEDLMDSKALLVL